VQLKEVRALRTRARRRGNTPLARPELVESLAFVWQMQKPPVVAEAAWWLADEIPLDCAEDDAWNCKAGGVKREPGVAAGNLQSEGPPVGETSLDCEMKGAHSIYPPVRAGGGKNGWMNAHCLSVTCTVTMRPC
jgi:hypothetical protein